MVSGGAAAGAFGARWREAAKRRVPIADWLPRYKLVTLAQDTLAGFTVGLTLIPQGIAYAYVAGTGGFRKGRVFEKPT